MGSKRKRKGSASNKSSDPSNSSSNNSTTKNKETYTPVERGFFQGEVHGYHVIALSSGRLLYLRRHQGKRKKVDAEEGTEGTESGLFIGNVSPRVDGESMKAVFGGNGVVVKGRMGGKSWFLRIDMSEEQIDLVLKGDEVDIDEVERVVEEGEIKGGTAVWLERYYAERRGVLEWARSTMADYEKKENLEKEQREKMKVDEDGWTIVGKKGIVGDEQGVRVGGVSKVRAEKVLGRKRERAEKNDKEMRERLYKFQRIEQQKKEAHKLRKQWQEQKDRITAMSKLKS